VSVASCCTTTFGTRSLRDAAHHSNGSLQALLRCCPSLDVNARQSCDGSTPLHCAAELGVAANVDALLAAGAAMTRRRECGDTPEDVARRGKHGAAVTRLSTPRAPPMSRQELRLLELEREVGVALHVQCGCAAATRCSRRVTKARSDAVFADRGEAVRSTADLMCDVVLRAWLRCTQGQHLLLQRMVGNVSSHPLSESRAVVELGAMAASIHVSMSAIASSSTGCLGMLRTVVLTSTVTTGGEQKQ
jgi:hypothetical protein